MYVRNVLIIAAAIFAGAVWIARYLYVAPDDKSPASSIPTAVPASPPVDPKSTQANAAYLELLKAWPKPAPAPSPSTTSSTTATKDPVQVFTGNLPPPPPPGANGAPDPEAESQWREKVGDEVANEAKDGQDVGALIQGLCAVVVTAEGSPEMSPLCSLAASIFSALGFGGIPAGEETKAGAAISSFKNGDPGPLREWLRSHPEVKVDLKKFLLATNSDEQLKPKDIVFTKSDDRPSMCNQLRAMTEFQKKTALSQLEPALVGELDNYCQLSAGK